MFILHVHQVRPWDAFARSVDIFQRQLDAIEILTVWTALLSVVMSSVATPSPRANPENCATGNRAVRSGRLVQPEGDAPSAPSIATRTVPPSDGFALRLPGESQCDWGTARDQTRLLERRQLIHAGDEQHRTGTDT